MSCGVGGSLGFAVVSSDGGVRGDRGGSWARRLGLPLPSHARTANSVRICRCFIAAPPYNEKCMSVAKLYRSSRLQHHQFCTSGDLIAGAAEETGHHTVLRGGDVLLHLHRFEDEERRAGFDMFAGLHEDMDDLPS